MARRRVTRKWEVFAGRNRFWCDGRLMTAPAPGVLALTLALVGGTAALHLACDGPFLARRVSPALPAGGAALAALALGALLRTALSDPGILPRAAPAEAALAPDPGAAGRPPPRAREVLVRGRAVKLKYCFTCKLFRPPRASHCSLCDNCVERFDHHCPWVGNCVGRRNYRSFYTFVVSLAFLCVWVLACALARLALEARAGGLAAALRAQPGSALAAAVCFLAVWSLLGLAGFHTYLAAAERTTNEDIKGSFGGRRGERANPYSRGGACANCWHVLCAPLAPSLIDRRGALRPEPELPPALWRLLHAPAAPVALAPQPQPPPPQPQPPPSRVSFARDGSPGGSCASLFPGAAGGAGGGDARHAYMNHSLDLDPTPLREVCIGGATVGSGAAGVAAGAAAAAGVAAGVAAGAAGGVLSAARRRLLQDTTMIDAALDLDEPEPPPLPAPAPAPAPASAPASARAAPPL